jgi:hypothetical protein
VHLDELSDGKAGSLDEVLVTPEMAFFNDCGLMWNTKYNR